MRMLLKFLPIVLVAAAMPALPAAQTAEASASPGCTLVVHVTGFRNQKGDAGGTLFSTPEGWPEDSSKSLQHGPFPITGDHATVTFEHLAPGRYAVAVIHDENENHKLDKNFLGIPKEGFGFANNPHVGLSAPSFNAAAVDVKCPMTTTDIKLIYKMGAGS